MNAKLAKEARVQTPRGEVLIRSFCKPDEIGQYSFNSQFGVDDNYKSLFTRRESLTKSAEAADANVVLALAESNNIVGYGVLTYPDPGDRWIELGPKIMMEVKVIEVCRTWRSVGIAPRLLEMMLRHPQIEDKIIYMVGYSWTWDLAGTHLTAGQYREKLFDLFQPHGFQEYETNEPNVSLKPENMLMCRIGKNITQVVKDRFKWLRFGLSPWTWEVDKSK
jgi:acetoin utilization protein AcuA